MREIVTFDAYATLINFELGPTTLKVLEDRLGLDNLDVDEFLDDFRVMRFQAVLEAYRPYHEILHSSLRNAMRLHGLEYRVTDGEALVDAVPTFGPWPEVPAALRQLKTKYEIAIISNTDDNLIARNVENIGVDFDYVITAQQAGAYKPDRQTFKHAFRTMGVEPSQVIHVAQGWEYDHIPTRDLGLKRRVWINRYGRKGSADYQPYDELPDLSGLPKLLGC
ncbi:MULTISPECIES: haloacid dehalogenase type II [unclassified Streptomyces]|uniref:haloacid dehalogenase type II n=1 Tax=unclassified Streptomyces TaxID=2593676 RepID=UPI00224FFE9B|nr:MULTISPECIES: haloacid dehalogenase type II [unclassified Streptomyces]MCX5291425.1 haloacid dehalogenase type II [Streptomyces sp. NBC_00183]